MIKEYKRGDTVRIITHRFDSHIQLYGLLGKIDEKDNRYCDDKYWVTIIDEEKLKERGKVRRNPGVEYDPSITFSCYFNEIVPVDTQLGIF